MPVHVRHGLYHTNWSKTISLFQSNLGLYSHGQKFKATLEEMYF